MSSTRVVYTSRGLRANERRVASRPPMASRSSQESHVRPFGVRSEARNWLAKIHLRRRPPTLPERLSQSRTCIEALEDSDPPQEQEEESQAVPNSGQAIGGPLGYTPFEYVTFGDNQLTHELSIEVESPVAILYAAWRSQENYGEWLDIIGHTILHKGDEPKASYFVYYQWGHLPAIELYVTLATHIDHVNRELYQETVDGFPLAVCALFEATGPNRSRVSLRVAYLMPQNLDLYVGPAGVWGDVNDILQSALHVMKEQVELGTAVLSFPPHSSFKSRHS